MTIEEYRNCESARLEANKRRMEDDGVNFVDLYSAYIDEEVVIEKGATIAQNVTISGKSIIRAGAYIGQSSVLKDAEVGSGSTVEASYIYESKVGAKTSVGPFAYIRPGSIIGDECKVGDFVEVKNSTIGDGSKSSHRHDGRSIPGRLGESDWRSSGETHGGGTRRSEDGSDSECK